MTDQSSSPEPNGAAGPQVMLAKPVADFIKLVAATAMDIENPGNMTTLAAQAQDMARKMRSAVQQRNVRSAIACSIFLAAFALLVFLAMTPFYVEDAIEEAITKEGGDEEDGQEAAEEA